jgi:anti-sigma-K factor RskA
MADLHSDPHPDLAGYLLGGLEPDEQRAFADHLAGCDACRAEVDELAGLPGLLADVPPAEPLPPGLEARTFAAIEAAAAEDEAAPASVVPITPTKKARWRPQTRWLAAAAAAVIVVAVGVGLFASARTSSPSPLATIRLAAANGGAAHGVATVRSTPGGLTIDMTVDGLPVTTGDAFYTCWLVGAGDTLAHPNRVSVGSFVVRSTGPVHVHWTTAADLGRFPHIGVTLEPNNGNPSHQGPKVLTGV